MEKPPSGSDQKIEEYTNRIKNGESKDSIFDGLPESFKTAINQKLTEPENQEAEKNKEQLKAQKQEDEKKQIEELRKKLGISDSVEGQEVENKIPINYIDIEIDDEYIKNNLVPEKGLRMQGGQANWNGEVDIVRYSISENLSPEYHDFVLDKIEKRNASQEKTYQHEAHHIQNRENGLIPHEAAKNLREFITFRVLDEMSAFATGELFNQEMTSENILQALKIAEKDITDSYYGSPFTQEASWYVSQHKNEADVFSREINPERYHQVMRQYFKINGNDILAQLHRDGKMSEFTAITNGLIIKLNELLKNSSIEN